MANVGTSGLERALVGTVPDVCRGQLASLEEAVSGAPVSAKRLVLQGSQSGGGGDRGRRRRRRRGS